MTDKINKFYIFYENKGAASNQPLGKRTEGSSLLPKKPEVVIIADFSENISTCPALLLVYTLVFGQYIPPQFIHIVIHTQICMYIHTYKRVINWIFVHVCVHMF